MPGFTRLIAWCRLRRDVRDFRSDRILKLRLEDEVFSGHAGFSLKGYREAEARSGEFQVARVRFAPEVMDRVRRERSWGLVEEQAEPEGTAVSLLDCSLEWLAGWVLSFGSKADVIAPEPLKALVAGEAEKVAARYPTGRPLVPMDPPLSPGSRRRSAVVPVPGGERPAG